MARSEDRIVIETLLDEAAAAVEDREWSAALRLCTTVRKLDPGSRVAAVLQSVCEQQLGGSGPEHHAATPARATPPPFDTRSSAARSQPPMPSGMMQDGPMPARIADPAELAPHDHSHDLDDVIASAASVAPFSPLAMRLLAVLDDELASADDVARLASMDQVLTARVLQAANSAYYRRRVRVATIKDAVMVLGASELRSLVIGTCVVGAMPPAEYIDQHAFWRFSMAVALLADLIARSEGDRTGEGFTAGILHNVGLLVLDRYCPRGLREVTALIGPGRLRLQDRERLVFGFTDAEIGAALAQRWRLPPTVVEAVRTHGVRRDEVTEQNRVATALVRARIFARAQGMSDGLESSAAREPGVGFLPARVQARLNAIGRWEDFLDLIDGLLAGAQDRPSEGVRRTG